MHVQQTPPIPYPVATPSSTSSSPPNHQPNPTFFPGRHYH
ncbi:pollen-specific leucine-rich repeat extensin-like protein 4 [Iris pallida]|uniref:Pollen-specific leucine-rich repeat extensin-like protein 4 n=1 Tax=Iris pallida TaxID=29817 RepID=A0AAX6GIY8_IRIPA|nr:pollen-specific leucine-rich repeat extensin-like protein 4 [Iris pallida]